MPSDAVARRRAFLFTDLEDSTVLWELHGDDMAAALARHDQILSDAVEHHGGEVFKATGDGIFAAFDSGSAAVMAAVDAQRQLATESWDGVSSLSVRMGVDVGEVEARDADYFGPVLNRCARIMASAHGGQVLLSGEAAEDDLRVPVISLGEYRFKGLGRPQEVFQAMPEGLRTEFPPLRIDRAPPRLPEGVFERRVRGYELREEVGGGDFGVVYRAYQPTVGREVAVKVIRGEYVDRPSFVRRFENEARLVARLEHPHIVALYDYWRDPDGAYLVMRWLRGGSLRAALDRGPFNRDAALEVLEQIGGALSYAHHQGVAHRDLKPSNIMLDETGNAYLTDFGIAVRLTDSSTQRVPLSSSPAYLPPEELSGRPITVRSDIFALGILTYELFTGRRPRRDGQELDQAELRTNVPEALAPIIERAVAENPENRFGTVDDFLDSIRRAFGREPSRSESQFTPSRNPYKGLYPFREDDAGDLYGRAHLIESLIQTVANRSVVTVVGPSGSGKSSVVRAGLIPALQSGALPGSSDWLYVTMYPGSFPFDELEAALLSVKADVSTSFGEDLRRDERGLLRAAKLLTPEDGGLFLLVDQAEELFTLVSDDATRRRFLDCLVAVNSDARSRVRIVLTLRADFFDRPLQTPAVGQMVQDGMCAVTALTDQELAEAIVRPAESVGVDIEPGLVEVILSDVHDQPGTLPLLQYALTEVFASRTTDLLTLDGYRESGGALGALGKRAEQLFEELDDDGRDACRQVFLRLVAVDEQSDDTRRRALRSEFDDLDLPDVQVEAILGAFGERRLLSFDRDSVSGTSTVEVAHEALLREWRRLAGWIDDRREVLVLHRRLTAAIDEWEANDRLPGYLIGGPRLVQFEHWADHTDLALTTREREYLEASRAREDVQAKKSKRRTRTLIGAIAVAALVAVLAVFAWSERAEANRLAAEIERVQTADRLVIASLSQLKVDVELATLLALEAVSTTARHDGTVLPEAIDAIHWALQQASVPYPVRDADFVVRDAPGGPRGVFLMEPDALVQHAAGTVDRTLTEAECQRFSGGPDCGSSFLLAGLTEAPRGPERTIGDLSGTEVVVSDAGLDNFAAWEQLQDELGVSVVPFEFDTELESFRQGNVADITALPQPGRIPDWTSEGFLLPVDNFVSRQVLLDMYGSDLVAAATIGSDGSWPSDEGSIYGIYSKLDFKSLVLYRTDAFEAAGYTEPETWEELERLIADIRAEGGTPWCMGMAGQGPTLGWPGTDWVEDILIHSEGPDSYHEWTMHELAFDSPQIVAAFELFSGVVHDHGVFERDRLTPADQWFFDWSPMFSDPPGCWLMRMANFAVSPAFMLEGITPEDFGFFRFPAPNPEFRDAAVVGGQVLVMFTDRPEVRAVMESLMSDDWNAALAADGTGLIADRTFDRSRYPTERQREWAEWLDEAQEAGMVRFDGSDLMPPGIGSTVFSPGESHTQPLFYKLVMDIIEDPDTPIAERLAEIDAAWTALEQGEG